MSVSIFFEQVAAGTGPSLRVVPATLPEHMALCDLAAAVHTEYLLSPGNDRQVFLGVFISPIFARLVFCVVCNTRMHKTATWHLQNMR